MRDWSSSKLGRPSASNATTSPSRISRRDPSALRHRPDLRVARGEVRAAAAGEREVAGVDVGDRAHAVPLDLEAVEVVLARELAVLGEHRRDGVGHRLRRRVGRRVHPVDHPVLALGLKQRVAALGALAVEGDDHLVVAELLGLVGAAVPDLHRARPVAALRDLAVEVEVLERVVLGAHRQAVLLRVASGCPSGAPRRRARRRARGAGPSAGCWRGAPAPRSARPRPAPRLRRLGSALQVAFRAVFARAGRTCVQSYQGRVAKSGRQHDRGVMKSLRHSLLLPALVVSLAFAAPASAGTSSVWEIAAVARAAAEACSAADTRPGDASEHAGQVRRLPDQQAARPPRAAQAAPQRAPLRGRPAPHRRHGEAQLLRSHLQVRRRRRRSPHPHRLHARRSRLDRRREPRLGLGHPQHPARDRGRLDGAARATARTSCSAASARSASAWCSTRRSGSSGRRRDVHHHLRRPALVARK